MLKEKNLQKLFDELLAVMQEKMTPRERDVIRLSVGLDDNTPRTITEIAQLFGCENKEIQRVYDSAAKKAEDIITNIFQIYGYKFLLFDIFNLYSKIPNDKTEELINVLDNCFDDIINCEKESENQTDCIPSLKTDILKALYGIYDGKRKSFAETGKLFGLPKDRVDIISRIMLRKLRHPGRSTLLMKFIKVSP